MTCTNGCDQPAELYVDHYRTLGESRIYPEGKAGSGLVCARCGAKHAEGHDAYEDYLATPPGERAAPHDGVAAPPPVPAGSAPAGPPSAQRGPEHDGSGRTATPTKPASAPALAVRWLGWLIDAILSLVRRKATR